MRVFINQGMRTIIITTHEILFITVFSWIFATSPLQGHDLFLRPPIHQMEAGDELTVIVFDGTIEDSIYAVPSSSVNEIIMLSPENKRILDTHSWEIVKPRSVLRRIKKESKGLAERMNLKRTSSFKINPINEGSHLIGLSLREFRVAMGLKEFKKYLEEEAASNMDPSLYGFSDRKDIIKERFTKCAKTLVQVGKTESDLVLEPMNQLVEIVPLKHPNSANVGDTIQFQLIEESRPIPNQSVIVGLATNRRSKKDDSPTVLTSDENGIINLKITQSGVWWMKFIRILPTSEDDPMDFYSRWASLTFEISG